MRKDERDLIAAILAVPCPSGPHKIERWYKQQCDAADFAAWGMGIPSKRRTYLSRKWEVEYDDEPRSGMPYGVWTGDPERVRRVLQARLDRSPPTPTDAIDHRGTSS